MLLKGIAFASLVVALASSANAAVLTTYASRSGFETAIGTPTTFNFNQPNGPISSLGTQLSISTVGGDASGQVLDNGLCGSFTGLIDCFDPLLFTFNQPGFRAFGYDNLDFTNFEEAVVTINFANADPSQVFVFDLGGQAAFTPIFFGVVSDVDIASVQIYSRDPGTTLVGQRANVVDNVTIGSASVSVPEPASLALLGIGLAGVSLTRRKRA